MTIIAARVDSATMIAARVVCVAACLELMCGVDCVTMVTALVWRDYDCSSYGLRGYDGSLHDGVV